MGDGLDLRDEGIHLAKMEESGFLLNNYARAVLKGEKFPPVYLVRYKEEYFVSFDRSIPQNECLDSFDGGNHRTTLHYFMDLLLDYEPIHFRELSEHSTNNIFDRVDDRCNLVSDAIIEFDKDALHAYFIRGLRDPYVKDNMSGLDLKLFEICTSEINVSSNALALSITNNLRNPRSEGHQIFKELRKSAPLEWNSYCKDGI
jgi:hypothetical protein